jgi:hypothetical protein
MTRISGLTVCVSRWWAGRDSLREQEKPEARKMLENGAESHQSAARFVSRLAYGVTAPVYPDQNPCTTFQKTTDRTELNVYNTQNLARCKTNL